MTEEQEEEFGRWDKMQVYEAYLLEHKARKTESERANNYQLELKRIEWELTQLKKSITSKIL